MNQEPQLELAIFLYFRGDVLWSRDGDNITGNEISDLEW